MEFYGRQQQIVQLQQYSKQTESGNSSMTLLVGRRRVGKTALIKKALHNSKNFIYLFVSRKSEALLCEEFAQNISEKLPIPAWANLTSMQGIMAFLLETSRTTPINIVFDEFQDFTYVNPSFYSDLQNLWDSNKSQAKMHLVLCGSIYSIMCKLFEGSKQPLFGRADRKIHLKPLSPLVIKNILVDKKMYNPLNLLHIYTITGGIPRYLELIEKTNAWELDTLLDTMLADDSFFLHEGKDVLVDEFGKDYKTYFSILGLVADGRTARSAIESVLQTSSGGYLDNLEVDFDIIQKHKPIFAKPNSRVMKYYIKDNFLNFWFRYFYKNQSAIEIGNYQYVKEEIKSTINQYLGKYLEKLILDLLSQKHEYNILGSYWEKGNQNEIDIVAVNERQKQINFIDVKLQDKKINLEQLKVKAAALMANSKDYQADYIGYSLDSLDQLITSITSTKK